MEKEMSEFYVIKKEQCQECNGDGVVYSHIWKTYYEEGVNLSPEIWACENGYDSMGPEEIECRKCGGTGVVRKEVPLEEALSAIRNLD